MEISALATVEEFSKRFENNFSFMAFLGVFGCIGFSGNLAWFLDSGATRNMTRMRNVFLSYSELNPGNFVGCNVCTRHRLVVKGVGSVKL